MASVARYPVSTRRAWRPPRIKLVRYALLTLLIATTFHALFGGIVLIADPSGVPLHLALERLANTPFHSYLVPGVLLIALVAIPSVVATVAVARRSKHAHGYCLVAGLSLCGFIAAQVLLIGARSAWQGLYLIVGIVIALLPGRLPVRSVLAPRSVR
jgi:hypothetical protein